MVELDPTGGAIFALKAHVSASPAAGHHSVWECVLLGTHSHSPVRPHSGGAFRTFPQPSSTPSSGLAFILLSPLFYRQLNIHKSSYSKRSALMLSSFWAVAHSCFLGNVCGYFSQLFPQMNFNRFSHLVLNRMAGLPSVVNIY